MELSINTKFQIGDDPWTIHTDQLVYLNLQDLCSDSRHQIKSYRLDQKFTKMDRDHQNIKIDVIPILSVQFNRFIRSFLACT